MAELRSKSLQQPDETNVRPGVAEGLVELGDLTIARRTHEAGWRWSTHMRPSVGGDWCQARHLGLVLSGRFGVLLKDGTKLELGPLDVYDIPPGHDAFTVGDEPCTVIEWSGVRAFAGQRAGSNRVLASLLFTDLVDSTTVASGLGDHEWRTLLSSHFEAARTELDRYRGREIKTAGDGLLATFDGPAVALHCAAAIRRVAIRDGLHIRAGVHVGEIELVGNDIRGVAVHEVARIMAQAKADEILLSDITRNLAGNAGLSFEDRGPHNLKGLPGEWRLYAFPIAPTADTR